jgi:hypothetical protein
MEQFRTALLENAKKREAEIIILADRSKFVPPSEPDPYRIDFQDQRVWLFADLPDDPQVRAEFEKSEHYKGFRDKLKDRFVLVDVNASSENGKPTPDNSSDSQVRSAGNSSKRSPK